MLAPTFDTVGIIARTVADVAEVFAVYQPAVLDAKPISSLRFIDALEYRTDLSGPQVCGAIDAALGKLLAAGAVRSQRPLPPLIEKVPEVWDTIAAYEASAVVPPLVARVSGCPRMEKLIEKGRQIDIAAYREARALRMQIIAELESLLAECDALVLPTAGEVPMFGSMGDAHFLRPWTLGGFPSLSIPVGVDAAGLPIGMQLVAKRGDDLKLVALALWVEAQLA
jgi:amidase